MRSGRVLIRSSGVVRASYCNAKMKIVLGSILASYDKVESVVLGAK